jgi:hypothetical protein
MKIKVFEEFKKKDLEPVSSFVLQETLHPLVFKNNKILPEVKRKLMNVATEFYNSLELKAEIYDVILTGSLSNYNWSKYSDYDLHIIIDFKDINSDVILVKKLVDFGRKIWNDTHDIKINGFDVEVYIQEKDEKHTASGIYSLLKDRWLIKPSKVNFTPDEELIKTKGINIMTYIDSIKNDFDNDLIDIDELEKNSDKLWDKIKRMRKDGLEEGEFGIGNLVFKFLRRNSYISKLINLRNKIYDKKIIL